MGRLCRANINEAWGGSSLVITLGMYCTYCTSEICSLSCFPKLYVRFSYYHFIVHIGPIALGHSVSTLLHPGSLVVLCSWAARPQLKALAGAAQSSSAWRDRAFTFIHQWRYSFSLNRPSCRFFFF